MIEYVTIEGKKYKSIKPNSFEEYKLLKKRIKSVKEKIRCFERGLTGETYKNYFILLKHLENNLN